MHSMIPQKYFGRNIQNGNKQPEGLRFTCDFQLHHLSYVLFLFLLILLLLPLKKIYAQSIPVGDIREEQYRLMQLISDSTTQTSFSNRPLSFEAYQELLKQNSAGGGSWWSKPMESPETTYSEKYPVTLGFYEPVLRNTYNSELPYSENNGAAWYGRGHNTEIQGGFYLTSEYFSLNFRPHIIHQQNEDFRAPRYIPEYRNDGGIRYVAEGFLPETVLGDRIDNPFRFGPDPFTTFDFGNSSLRFHYKSMEVGLSSEPLWWGPGVQYALMMSNNSAGVYHAFLGTRKPLELPLNIGNVEFRWVMGKPVDSKYFDLNLEGHPHRKDLSNKFLRDRFMNGLNVVYSPSFLPNLELGFSRIIHQYIRNDKGLAPEDYFTVFIPFPKPSEEIFSGFRDESHFLDKNPMSSVYFRWVLPESSAEIYGEYYRENHNWNWRDFLMEPQHGRAYTIGIQKIIYSNIIDFVKVNGEFNSLLPGRIDDVRPQPFYYTHQNVKQGHTNRGQILGAAIGTGSTSQYIGIDGYFKKGKLGFFIQRMVENDHFHYEWNQRLYPGNWFKDQYRHQVNLNIGTTGQYQIGKVLLKGSVIWNKNFDYGRFNYGRIQVGWNGRLKEDIINMQYKFAVRYLF